MRQLIIHFDSCVFFSALRFVFHLSECGRAHAKGKYHYKFCKAFSINSRSTVIIFAFTYMYKRDSVIRFNHKTHTRTHVDARTFALHELASKLKTHTSSSEHVKMCLYRNGPSSIQFRRWKYTRDITPSTITNGAAFTNRHDFHVILLKTMKRTKWCTWFLCAIVSIRKSIFTSIDKANERASERKSERNRLMNERQFGLMATC